MKLWIRQPSIAIAMTIIGCGTTKQDAADDDGIGVPTSGGSTGAQGESTGADDDGGVTGDTAGASATGSTTGPETPPPIIFDVGLIPDGMDYDCGAPTHVECDGEGEDDPWRTIGLNCPNGQHVDGVYNGDPESLFIQVGNLGTYNPPPYPPREGDAFLIMSSGRAQDMTVANMYASSDIMGYIDGGANPPPPIVTTAVSPTDDCNADPGLVGQGDCSNTIEAQWNQGSGAYDYNEMRFTVDVPFETFGFSYDFAMFSTEYPVFYQSGYNDMYIAWLESENWTGNISFDEMGHPISLNAGFLDYKDAENPYDCPAPCQAPELEGTAMVGHAGTKWLTTTAGVTPGEEIEVVFAVFDLSDPILDTVVLLDNFHWACEGGPPTTIPG